MSKWLMSLSVLLMTVGCASCQLVKDQADSPSVHNQARLVMKVGNSVEVGMHGTIDVNQKLMVRSYGKGGVTLRGLEDCGFVTSGSTDKVGWVGFDVGGLPNKEFCLYSIQARTNGFDAPAIGFFAVRRFLDSNVLPLEFQVNGSVRNGVGFVQVSNGDSKLLASNGPIPFVAGIPESHDVILNLGGHSGKLNVTGCGFHPDIIDYEKAQAYPLTLEYFYREAGKISKSCVFTITANHDDAPKQSATLVVNVYEGFGSFLDAPMASGSCFEFTDPYVVGISINGKWKRGSRLCVKESNKYVVEAVTSKYRGFYGEHDGKDWVVMK